jgi:tetratricopeptide (TPR) repeat protein/MoxR-like ATPase
VICANCKTSARAGARRCERCSRPLPPTCISCGDPVAEGIELCNSCSTERIPTATLASLAAEDLWSSPPPEGTRVGAPPFPLSPRFVGRDAAHDRMVKAFDDGKRRSQLAFFALIGPPGAGKTRLVRELARTLKSRAPNARFLAAKAGTSEAMPYAGFARLFEGRFGLTRHDSPEDAQQKILAAVGEVLPQRTTEVAHLFAQLLGRPFTGSPVVEPLAESPQQLEARTFIAVKRFLAADAARAPMVLCLDEIEEAAPETINLLHYLAAGLGSAPVMLMAVGRSELFERHPTFGEGDTPLERHDLGPLEAAEAEALLREILRALDAVPEEIVAHATKLGGLPRTLIEFVRLLLEAQVIVRSDRNRQGWTIDRAALSRLSLPARKEDLPAARLAQLPREKRDLLEKASAVGEIFWLDAVVALLRTPKLKDDPDGPPLAEIATAGDATRHDAARALAELVESEWLVEVESSVTGEREYRFAYPPLRDVVAAGADAEARRRNHRVIAQWLELRPEGRDESSQEQIARHLEEAGDREAAAACYRRAADEARAHYHHENTIKLYGRALACLAQGNLASRIHLWHDLGSVFELKGDFEAALGAFERMLRLTWVVSSRAKAAVAFNKMGRVWRRKGDLKLALEYLMRGQDLFEQAGDVRGIAGSLDDVGQVLYLLGRYEEAGEKITEALARRGKGGDKRSIAHSLSNLGNVQKDRGRLTESESCHKQALDLRREIDDRAGVVLSRNNLAVLAFERGDKDGARRLWEQALSEAEKIGALPLQALVLANMGETALVEGKPEEARRRLEETMALARDLDDRRLLCESARNLGLLELEEGNAGRARELTTRALEIAESAGLRDGVGRALLALGEVHAGTLFDADKTLNEDGVEITSEEFFKRGVELFRQLGNDSELAKGLERFGRYKLERGDVAGGRELLREAQAIFSRLGMKAGEAVKKMIGEVEG